MKPFSHGALVGVLLAFFSPDLVAHASEWKAMEFADLTQPGPMSWIAGQVWPDVAARENDYLQKVLKRPLPAGGNSLRVLAAQVNGAGAEFVVSVVLSLECEAGSNHNSASAEPSICPMRIARKEQGRWIALLTDRACFVDPQDSAAPAANRFDGAQVRFDEQRRMIHLRANVGGAWLSACTRSFSIP